MMEIVWRNPNRNPHGIVPRSAWVVQIQNDEPQSPQVRVFYLRGAAAMGPAIELEVLVNARSRFMQYSFEMPEMEETTMPTEA
jgi:hypothetical protein